MSHGSRTIILSAHSMRDCIKFMYRAVLADHAKLSNKLGDSSLAIGVSISDSYELYISSTRIWEYGTVVFNNLTYSVYVR